MKPPPEEERDYTPEELAKAERATWIIYGFMAVMIVAPFVVAWLIN